MIPPRRFSTDLISNQYMWLVGSSCLCKLMTSLFSVVSSHRFVLLAHWSPCRPLLSPSSSSVVLLPVCLWIAGPMISVLQDKIDHTACLRKASALLWSMLETGPVPIHFPDLTLKTFETNSLANIIQQIVCIFHVLGAKMITHAKVIWVY